MPRLAAAALAVLHLGIPAAPALAERVTAGDLVLDRAQLEAAPEGTPVAGGYLVIVNLGDVDDRLVAASSPAAGAIAIHEMPQEGGEARPSPDGLAIPSRHSVFLHPAGHRLVLSEPRPLALGETHEITLSFERAGEVAVPFEVATPEAIRESLTPIE